LAVAGGTLASDPPLVSVVTPTYNRAYCLPRAIDSVFAQSHQRLEYVLLDDGSTDDTRRLISERYGHDPRMRYFHQPNRGVTAARNAALAEVRGDYVAFIDSDDYWQPWKLELQLACMKAHPEVGMTFSDLETIDLEGRTLNPSFSRSAYDAYRWFTDDELYPLSERLCDLAPQLAGVVGEHRLRVGDLFSPMVMGNMINTTSAMLTRERLSRVGGFREDLTVSGEDYDFHLRTCREGPIGFLTISTAQYQQGRPDHLTNNKYRIHLATNFLKTLETTLQEDRDRITLPEWMLDTVVAEAHRWVGECHLDLGQMVEARPHLWKTLRMRPKQPRVAAYLAMAMLPAGVTAQLRAGYRAAKRLLARKPVEESKVESRSG
jgi:glycosyltransferase involved in cell wall biosynthesis